MDARLAAAFCHAPADAPALLVGMDTPQLTGAMVSQLPLLTDVDTPADAALVAAQASGSRFAAHWHALNTGDPVR
ncbi:hypothetical protein GCM10010442_65360 [Kitasatospora kifunensis]